MCVWVGGWWELVVGLIWFGLGWFDLVWFGLAWLGLAWLGLAWLGLAWLGLAWLGLAWLGLAWLGLAWLGLDWIGLDWFGVFGLVCLVLTLSFKATCMSTKPGCSCTLCTNLMSLCGPKNGLEVEPEKCGETLRKTPAGSLYPDYICELHGTPDVEKKREKFFQLPPHDVISRRFQILVHLSTPRTPRARRSDGQIRGPRGNNSGIPSTTARANSRGERESSSKSLRTPLIPRSASSSFASCETRAPTSS